MEERRSIRSGEKNKKNKLMTKEKRSVFEFIIEVLGWIQIVASPLFIGVVIGFIVYLNIEGSNGLLIGISIAALGLIIGVIWATRAWRKKGTIELLSKLSATPELDDLEKEEKKKVI